MKKLVLTIVCAAAATSAVFAQGTVNWNTGFIPTAITVQTNGTVYSPLFGGGSAGGVVGVAGGSAPAGTGFYYELLYYSAANNNAGIQLSGNSAPSNSFAALFGGGWADTGLTATNTATPGRLASTAPKSGATVPWANGTTNSIILVGWSANLGTTWGGVSGVSNLLATSSTFAAGSFFGVSTAGYINPSPSTSGVGPFATGAAAYGLPINNGTTVGDMQLFALPVVPVPEPSTIALAGLGGLSLLLFRRRK